MIAPSEVSRSLYAWSLKLFLNIGQILCWTLTVSITISHYSIFTLPAVFMVGALLNIVGMFIYSVLNINYSSRKLIIWSTVCAAFCLLCASFFYETKPLLLMFIMIANGLFMSQILILVTNHLEDFFTPNEGERLFPIIDSAETIAGIIGGLILITLGFTILTNKLIWLWCVFLIGFLFIFCFVRPELPFYLRKLEKISEHHEKKSRFNGFVLALNEIKKTQFLQVMLLTVVINVILAQFIEFVFAKAVTDTALIHAKTEVEHEVALIYGFGSMQILLHASALVMEFLLAGRILKYVGTLGGFLLHGIISLFSIASMIFSYGFLTAVLTRNNFEVTLIVNRTAYETCYYAFKFGTQKAIREIFEGFFSPIGTIIATGIVLFLEFFFIESHLMLVLVLLSFFTAILFIYFSQQMRGRYMALVKENVVSEIPIIKEHASELLRQIGREEPFENVKKMYYKSGDRDIQIRIIESFGDLNEFQALPILMENCRKNNKALKRTSLNVMSKIMSNARNKLTKKEIGDIILCLQHVIGAPNDMCCKQQALKILSQIDYQKIRKYLLSKDVFIKAQAYAILFKLNLDKEFNLKSYIKSHPKDKGHDLLFLALISKDVKNRKIKRILRHYAKGKDVRSKLIAEIGLLNMHDYSYSQPFINLLLFSDKVIFNKGLKFISGLDNDVKRTIVKALIPEELLRDIPVNRKSIEMIRRMKAIYKEAEADDEIKYFNNIIN